MEIRSVPALLHFCRVSQLAVVIVVYMNAIIRYHASIAVLLSE